MNGRAFRLVRAARAIHRLLILLAPAGTRALYRDEMIATFDAALAEAAGRGVVAVVTLLFRETTDLAVARRANRPAALATRSTSGERPEIELFARYRWSQAWRSLRRRPVYFGASVLTLAAGTGITAAVFSLVDTVVVKPLPYPDSEQLVTVYESSPSAREKTSLVAPGRLEDWQRLTRTFVALSASYTENVTDTSGAEPERLQGRRVAPRFFDVFAQPPVLGRWFTADEERANGPAAAIISEPFWTRRYYRDRAACERRLVIGGRSYQIVGVMPRTFTGDATDVWLPAQISPALLRVRQARFLGGVGRIRPGLTIEEAARDLAAVQSALAREYPRTDSGWSAEIRSLKQARIGESRRNLLLAFGAVGALWTIAIANIAGLTLVQIRRRTQELALRAALGASRARVIATVLREGLLISLVGGGLGAVFASWLLSVAPRILTRMPRMNELTLDWRALGFVTLTSLLASCAFSIVPGIVGTRPGRNRTIRLGHRTTAAGTHLVQAVLVVGQVALSVLLVGSAVLLLRSYYNLARVDAGFDASDVLTFHVGARWDEDRARVGQLQARLLAMVRELPHVEDAGLTNFLPAAGATLRFQVQVDGLTGPNADGSIDVGARMISGGYLRAIRAPLVAGSWCEGPATHPSAPRTALLNRRFAEVHALGQNLIGRSLRFVQFPGTPFTIVGIVGNIAEDARAATAVPYVYSCDPAGSWPDPEYVVRTADAGAFATDLRRIMRELDPNRAIFGLRPLRDVLDSSLEQPRLDAALLGLFAAAAVALASTGLYSLFTLVVADRARELAVRLAIGARPKQMIRLVMSGAGRLLGAGIALGIVLTVVAGRVLQGFLFGMAGPDAHSLAAAAATLTLAALLAVAAPAFRASRIAPIDALRTD